VFGFGAILTLAGRAAHLEAVRPLLPAPILKFADILFPVCTKRRDHSASAAQERRKENPAILLTYSDTSLDKSLSARLARSRPLYKEMRPCMQEREVPK